MVNFTSYTNGSIRNAGGKLVAHYDSKTGELNIDGCVAVFQADNIEHAMDLVVANFKG